MERTNTDASMQRLPRLSAHDPRFATIFVGSEKLRFVVHQDLLTYHSEFFNAALTGNFKEALKNTVTIPDVDPLIFEFFVHWLYHQSLPEEDNTTAALFNKWVADDDDAIKTENLIRLYVLGDKYGIEDLKISTLRELFLFMAEDSTSLPNGKQVSFAYDHLPASSPLLTYLVDLFCAYAGKSVWEDNYEFRHPAVFVTAVLRRYTEYARGGRDKHDELILCDYHEHEDGSEEDDCPDKSITSL